MEPCKYARDCVILIVGGMGPLAGIQCYKYVLENYKSDGTDQDNLDTVVVSYPGRIENRVDYVLGRSSINPGDCVLRFIKPHIEVLMSTHKKVVVGIPCVTFHCPAIFTSFCDRLHNEYPNVQVISIVKCTADFISLHCPTISRIGIMSTDGTRSAKPFKREMDELDKSLVYLTDEQQAIVTDCIFNTEWGVKSPSFRKEIVHKHFCKVMDSLLEEGCEAIILGCTEIPLAIEEKYYKGIPILNPSWILARSLIQEVDASKVALL